MTSTSSACMEHGNLQSIASITSQLGSFSSDTTHVSQASSKVDTSPYRYVTQDKVIDTTYPIALVDLSSANQPEKLTDDLQRQLPGKAVMLFKDIHDLAGNWHLFETILVDFGPVQEAASNSSDEYKGTLHIYGKCRKEMLVPQNLAQLMLAPANTPSDPNRASDTMSQFPKLYGVPVFQYSSEPCRPSLFDDDTKNQLVSFLLDSCERYHTAVNKKRPGVMERVQGFLLHLFESS
ncbi:uncharacterized protein LOC105442938 [Strongylocentrotus purpuratus]|uniref:Uncharacterized protein n=1 Tax=Strongylocentrotus purpuratus TaxID=7668 RepID=A0A7M7PCB8_STRPU|nr:uncharacterized protein LOC105442938 [Strongylocentrotus purpuratus]